MRAPGVDHFSRARSPVEVDTAAQHMVCEIIASRYRPEHFANVRRFGTHVRNLDWNVSAPLVSRFVL
jgi:hypothetical protein